MGVFHLTALENEQDYRIRQGSRYSVVFSIPGDYSTGYNLAAHIRQEIDSPETLAIFNVAAPSFDGTNTTWLCWLTSTQTNAIPFTTRNDKANPKIGKDVWTWDLLLIDLNNSDNNLRLYDPSWVEVVAGVTEI